MNNFFKRFSIEVLKRNLKYAFFRFPVSFLSNFFIFFILIFLIHQDFITKILESNLIKSIFSLVIFYFFSIGVYFLGEKYRFSRLKIYFSQFLVFLFSLSFYFYLPYLDNFFVEDISFVLITFLGVIAFMFISFFIKDFFNKKLENNSFYSFFMNLFTKIILSIFVGISLMLLGFLALWALFALFELSKYFEESKFFGYWASFSLSLFAPIYFLIKSPKKDEYKDVYLDIKENNVFSFINNYLAIPFIIIYFFILYSYSVKVLLNFSNWPNGIISWMIILFSIFGFLAFIFSYVFNEKLTIVRIFRKYFPYAVIFQTPMLFYAIYLRIAQYDFTINRYLILIFGFYLVLISLYYIFSSKKYLFFIPALFTLFILVISIGPWGVYNFPESRQLNLLKTDLIDAKIIVGDSIVLPNNKTNIEAVLLGKIYDKVSYLCDYHGCESISFLENVVKDIKIEDEKKYLESNKKEIEYMENLLKQENLTDKTYLEKQLKLLKEQKYTGINNWDFKQALIDKLKVEPYNLSGKNQVFNFNTKYDLRNAPIKLENYDYIFDLIDFKTPDNVELNNTLYAGKIDLLNYKLMIYKNKQILEEFDLKNDFAKFLLENKKYINSFGTFEMDKDFIIEKIGNKIDVKLYLSDFSLIDSENTVIDKNIYLNAAGKVLLNEK